LSSPRLVQYASWPVREMSSPWVVQSVSWQSASWRIHELSSNLFNQWCHPCFIDCWRSTVNKSITYRKGLEMWIKRFWNFLPDSGINARFYARKNIWTTVLVTMSTSTNKHRYKNKLLGLLLPPPWRKTLREISNFIVKNLLYLICIVSLMTDT